MVAVPVLDALLSVGSVTVRPLPLSILKERIERIAGHQVALGGILAQPFLNLVEREVHVLLAALEQGVEALPLFLERNGPILVISNPGIDMDALGDRRISVKHARAGQEDPSPAQLVAADGRAGADETQLGLGRGCQRRDDHDRRSPRPSDCPACRTQSCHERIPRKRNCIPTSGPFSWQYSSRGCAVPAPTQTLSLKRCSPI
jgi:hypothetical protein